VQNSRVILTGVVNNQLMKQKAESIIRGTPGVLSVESRLRLGY
jgi:osmotically-inducible protein OsmY